MSRSSAYETRAALARRGAAHPRRVAAAGVGSVLIPGITTTVGDRERVLEELHTGFVGLQSDIFRAAGWRADHPADEGSPIWRWWESAARPTVEEWQKFYADQAGSWWSKFHTDWDVYTHWQDRLLQLREAARARLGEQGYHLDSPDPGGIPRTPWDGLGDKTKHLTDDLTGVLKALGYGVAAVAGIVAISAVASATRSQR